MTRTSSTLAAVLVAAMATAATAQPAQGTPDQDRLRRQIYLMEGALARAVTAGAARLNQQFRAVMPDMVGVTGESNARGFYLEGYGIFFDVEVPVLRQSMMWSLRTILDQDDQGARDALASLRAVVSSTRGPDRQAAEAALTRLEAQLRPFGMVRRPGGDAQGVTAAGQVSTATSGAQAVSGAASGQPALSAVILEDPNKAYTDVVVQALVEAMIDYSLPMVSLLKPDDYLTVAARDNERRDLLAPPNPFERVSTLTLRITAADLAAYRAGKIDLEVAKQRVRVQEF